jgi:hypothetical protein
MVQKEIIRKHLEKKGSITGAVAFTKLNVYRLSEYIRRLRGDGMDIVTVMKTDRNTGKEYAVYTYQKGLDGIRKLLSK